MTVKALLLSDDPLSASTIRLLIDYREEDLHVDYKESFEPNDNKHWLELTKDAMAFANTHGGYIILGVRYQPFEILGLKETTIKILSDANNILQKINRYIAPPFTDIRTKEYETESGHIVVILVPESKGKTHIVIREANHKYPDGKTQMILYPGMIYVRRSGTNHVISPTDLESIMNRRIDYYKESLFDKITKVIKAPMEHEMVIIDPTDSSGSTKKIKLTGDHDAIAVKGVSFTIAPKTDQEEIAGWIAMRKRDKDFIPRVERLWHIYSNRMGLKDTISDDHIAELIRLNLLRMIPVFYWMQFIATERSKKIIRECIDYAESFHEKASILHVGAIGGRGFYNSLLRMLGKDAKRLNVRSQSFPGEDLSVYFNEAWIPKDGKGVKAKYKPVKDLEDRLNYLAAKFSASHCTNDERWEAEAIDYYLYAPRKEKRK